MTTQEAYEKMLAYFKRPGAQRAIAGGECFYRGVVDGRVLKCAIGCLIPRRCYSSHLELYGPDEMPGDLPDIFGDIDIDFLEDAQTAHDTAASVPEVVINLNVVAEKYDLKVAR